LFALHVADSNDADSNYADSNYADSNEEMSNFVEIHANCNM